MTKELQSRHSELDSDSSLHLQLTRFKIKFGMMVAFILLLDISLFAANECIVCHKGIENIRDKASGMTKAILEVAEDAGHKGNDCIVCHGGNPYNKSKKYAHMGTVEYFKNNKGPKEFYPAPGSTEINQNSCGMCHQEQVNAQMNSLMMSEQDNIQGALWSFGAKNGRKHDIGMYASKNPDDPHKRLGSEKYKSYMSKLALMEPQAFPTEMKELPAAPTDEEVEKDPSLSVYTFLHKNNSKNTLEKGCASCHMPYSEDGYYKGDDKSINKNKKGHTLVHSLQSSRDVHVKMANIEYSGIPLNTCSKCHDSEKSVADSYRGLLKKEKDSSSDKYIHMHEDIHFQKGMLCQDCHTSNDMHGDGFLSGANAVAVEVECQDCHGTTKAYPWELPLGYSDEFNTTVASGEARGTTQSVAEYLKKGSVSDVNDGYILTARGNPFTHATKVGDNIKIELASGKDIILTPLKKLKESNKLSKEALLAMDGISAHNDTLECYTCHALWAPQSYGSHLEIDYSKNSVTQSKDFVRFEDPALCQNGEGRVSPAIPDIYNSVTVIDKKSKMLLKNHKYMVPDTKKQYASGVLPIQPHTITKKSRSCESCHATSKAMGMGIGSLKSIYDETRFLDENATQLRSVGSHLKLSAPLSEEQRDRLDRSGICLSCHVDIPKGNLAISAMVHMSEMSEMKIDNKMHKNIVNKTLHVTAWVQIIAAIFVGILVLYLIYYMFFKKKPYNSRNEGWK